MTAASTLRAASAVAFLLLTLAPEGAGAQTLKLAEGPAQELDFDNPEAWAMEWTASLTLLTSLGPPRARETGELELGLELDWIPSVSEDERRVGFNGSASKPSTRRSMSYGPLPTASTTIPCSTCARCSAAPSEQVD
jgi:hypothetical protein